jgi:hypothetical protein
MDGRLLLLLSVDSTKEPRYQITDGPNSHRSLFSGWI